jgi:hypothetical protein
VYEWLIFALIWTALWLLFYLERPFLRKRMLWASLFGALIGLAEPFFVPRYWTPPSLFSLNEATRFDVESIIFFFASSGIAAIMYEAAVGTKFQSVCREELGEKNRLHLYALGATPAVFLPLYFLTNLNPIYCVSIAMLGGAIAALAIKPALVKNVLLGGVLFTGLNFFFFAFISSAFPAFLNSWNLSTLTGIHFWGIPVETLMFGFTFGMMWSGVYLHIKRHVLLKQKPAEPASPVQPDSTKI